MSYEGREQHICENGHLFEIDCQYSFDDNHVTQCIYCSGHSVWQNYIDDTNGESFGEVLHSEFEKILISPTKFEVCNLGHNHLILPAVYRIPGSNELEQSFVTDGGVYYSIEDYNKYHGIQNKSAN